MTLARTFLVVLVGCADPSLGESPIVEGTIEFGYPEVVRPVVGPGAYEDGLTECTATLIACDWALTAAHCICDGVECDPLVEGPRGIFAPHAGYFEVTESFVHPDWEDARFADIALIHLAGEVTGIQPRALATAPPVLGAPGTILGFGLPAFESSEKGIKRSGTVEIAACSEAVPTPSDKVCWDYEAGAGSNTCFGDSGGPLLIGGQLAGVTVDGTSYECTDGDNAYDARVDLYYASFIEPHIGAGAKAACGGFAPIEPADVNGFSESLSVGQEAVHEVVVEGDAQLRIALHGDNDADFDLQISAPDGSIAHEALMGANELGYHEVDQPLDGIWSVRVTRATSTMANDDSALRYQVVATHMRAP